MTIINPILILQLRVEDSTAESEYACILKYGNLKEEDTCRMLSFFLFTLLHISQDWQIGVYP